MHCVNNAIVAKKNPPATAKSRILNLVNKASDKRISFRVEAVFAAEHRTPTMVDKSARSQTETVPAPQIITKWKALFQVF